MIIGLENKQVKAIQLVLSSFPEIEEAVLFGSRAKGNFKPGSDIDLALKGKTLSLESLLLLYNSLEELELPYTFDLVNYSAIKEPDLADHINRIGKVVYTKSKEEQRTT